METIMEIYGFSNIIFGVRCTMLVVDVVRVNKSVVS
jgi:hypothetical protein